MKEEPNYPSVDAELEARIVALVLGEASDFERDDLNRLIEARPELAAFKEEIQSVHGLLRDVGAGESVAEDDDWKLSAEKRNAVLAAISPEAKEQPVQLGIKSADQIRSKQRSFLNSITKIAAVFCIAGFFGGMAISSWLSVSARRQVASSEANIRASIDASESFLGETSAPAAKVFMADGAVAMTLDESHLRAAEAKTIAESDYSNSSKSALSSIRESLGADVALPTPDYLMDDTQYLPSGPEFKLSRETPAVTAAPPASGGLPAVDNELLESGGDLFSRVQAERSAAEGGLRAEVRAQLRAARPEPPQQSADDLALIPQGFESGRATASVDALAWQDSFGVNSGLRDRNSDTGGETEDAGKRIAGLGKGARPVVEGKPESSPELAMPALGVQESGQADEAQERETQGSDRYGVDGFAAAGKPRYSWSAEPLAEQTVERDLGAPLSASELSETAPTKPTVAGSGGRKMEADKASAHVDFDMGIRSHAISDPTSESMSLRVESKTKEASEGFKDKFSKGRLTMPSDGEISLHDSRILDEGESNGRRISVPLTGTAIGQPRGELQVGQANQDLSLRYYAQPKTPQREPAGMERRSRGVLPDDSRNGVETSLARMPSAQDVKRGELLPQHDQLAVNEPNRRYRYVPPTSMLKDDYESQTRRLVRRSVAPAGLNEKTAEEEAFSTFSLHVSDVSFKLAQAALANGKWPEAAKVRIEEFVNAFDYGDPMPSQSETVACRVEQSAHPFLQQRNLLRVSMRTAAAGRSSDTPLRLTLLLDNSGSMERIDRQQTVRRAFALLAQQLKPIDQVTLISFARQPRLLADKVSGAQSSQLVGLIENLPSEGGTNIEAALQLAFEKAREQQVDNAQNRIILLTDGAVNLGDANPESLSRMIGTMRVAGIAFDAAGISAEGLNDEILEALTRKGDGRYYLLDSLESADDGFARQIAGALRPSAGNVKVQIEFNPKRVGHYKLLGFEKHRLKQEDFRNDKVDAAEMAAAEAGVAVYHFEAKPDGEGDVGSVSVRFRDVSTGQMIENCWPIPYQPDAPRLDQAAPSLRIASSAALLAAKLRGEALGETVDLRTLSNLIAGLPDQDRNADRVGQLQQMIEQARQVSGK